MSTTTIDAEVQRLVEEEREREEDARIERIRQTVIERQAREQAAQDLQQRIADQRRQAVELREQAAQIRAEAEPHLAALERIEGVRPTFGRARSAALDMQAHRLDLNTEELEWRQEHPR